MPVGPVAGYLRVSHVGARGGDRFHSPANQAAEIEAWARSHGRRIEMLPPELDAKGSDSERPIFRRAVEGVKAGEYSGVVVAYLSRAGRDLRLMLDLWDEVEAAGGAVYSAREDIDASTASGRLHRNLLASIAQHELEERRDGFDRARRSAVARGIWQRRQTPRGYRRDETTRRLAPDSNADSVRTAARDFLAGEPILALSKRLGMTPSGVRALLRNRVYLGELRVGEHLKEAAHEPLLDRETFEAVQTQLDSKVRPARNGRAPALLAGLVRCASCGHVMTRGRSGADPVYTCPTHHSGEPCPAPASIACSRLDAYVEPIALAELARLKVTATAGDGIARTQQVLADAERELAAYLEAVDVAGIGPADAARGMSIRRERVDRAREQLRAQIARTPALPRIRGGAEIWPDLDAYERNELLRSLLTAIVVRPVGRGRKVPVGDRARVLRYGAAIRLPGRGAGDAAGIVAIPWPEADDVGVLGVPAGEDAL